VIEHNVAPDSLVVPAVEYPWFFLQLAEDGQARDFWSAISSVRKQAHIPNNPTDVQKGLGASGNKDNSANEKDEFWAECVSFRASTSANILPGLCRE
jgi:hypothetical protein